MSIFVPGFAITRTASGARSLYRADPFSDEDIDFELNVLLESAALAAGAGSRYCCFFFKIHQLASAR